MTDTTGERITVEFEITNSTEAKWLWKATGHEYPYGIHGLKPCILSWLPTFAEHKKMEQLLELLVNDDRVVRAMQDIRKSAPDDVKALIDEFL
jgi:pheromone shutdown protein TraB